MWCRMTVSSAVVVYCQCQPCNIQVLFSHDDYAFFMSRYLTICVHVKCLADHQIFIFPFQVGLIYISIYILSLAEIYES